MNNASEKQKQNSRSRGAYYNCQFATVLRELLKKKEFNQNKIASQLKITRQSISIYANGDSLPDINKLKQIITFFKENGYDYSSDYWLGFTSEPSTDIKVKAINKKYGLSDKALKNLEAMQQHKYLGDTIIDTTNKLLEQDFYKNLDGSAIISLIDSFLEENGNGIALTMNRKNGSSTTISGKDVINAFLIIIERELSIMKERKENECKGN